MKYGNFLLGGLLFLSVTASAQDAKKPTISGKLEIDGKTFAFLHVAAFKHDNAEGIYDNAKSIKILFADAEIPKDTLASVFRPAELARQGKLHGVVLEVDPAKSEGFNGRILYDWGSQNVPTVFFTVLNHEEHKFTAFKYADGWITGTVRMTAPSKHSDFEIEGKPVTYQYAAEFRVKVEKPAPVTATLTGEQARNSPQVKVVLAYTAAGKRGDMAALRRLAPPETFLRYEEMKQQVGEKEAKAMFDNFWKSAPSPEVQKKQITKVVVRGERATVIMREKGGLSWQTLLRKNGVWTLTDF